MRALQAIHEDIAELGEGAELLLGVDGEGVARHDALLVAVGDDGEAVGRRLGADADAGEVLAKQVADESRLAYGRKVAVAVTVTVVCRVVCSCCYCCCFVLSTTTLLCYYFNFFKC